jgi:small subunit ribosomal protein S9
MATAINQHCAVGRRKNAVARVYLRPGNGKVVINKREMENYFPLAWRRKAILSPFDVTETAGSFDLVVNAKGGGQTGQAEAIRMGISRALVSYNEEFRPLLRGAGFLTRDPRMVERKKPGQPKARKRFQFSKR